MGTRRMQDLVRQLRIRIKDAQQKIVNITNCKACQLTNVVINPQNPGTKLSGTKPVRQWTSFCVPAESEFGHHPGV